MSARLAIVKAWRAVLDRSKKRRAVEKRRLEALLRREGMSRSQASRVCADYFGGRDT